jgi:hypothetical protein
MPAIELAALRAEMEAEREWRERELRILRNLVASMPDEDMRGIGRKALVVMLYAHFEGATKALLSMYVNRLNGLGLLVSEVVASIGAATVEDVFRVLRDPNRKCKEFARELPDDSALHRFAREREFVEVAWKVAARTVRIEADNIVNTESNLKPVVLKKVLFRLGLDPKLADPWESIIHQLLNRRNNVAHGSGRASLDAKTFGDLEQAVTLVLDELIQAISKAVVDQTYRVAAAG